MVSYTPYMPENNDFLMAVYQQYRKSAKITQARQEPPRLWFFRNWSLGRVRI